MKAEIYSKTNCVFCDKAKIRLSKYNPTVHMLDQDYTRKDFFKNSLMPKPFLKSSLMMNMLVVTTN